MKKKEASLTNRVVQMPEPKRHPLDAKIAEAFCRLMAAVAYPEIKLVVKKVAVKRPTRVNRKPRRATR